MTLDEKVRGDFPFLHQRYNGYPLAYLDSASTAQKPRQVLQAMTDFYANHYANIHRSSYQLAEQATMRYEAARATIAQCINADPEEIIFTPGTTAGINAIAHLMRDLIQENDEIVISALEHHANFLPWQRVAAQKKALLRVIPIDDQGRLQMAELAEYITPKTRLVAITHCSNAIGTHVDLAPIVARARAVNALVLVDAAQSVAHQAIDCKQLDIDFLVFSGHKLFGPTGVGILYIKKEIAKQLEPFNLGGGMVFEARYEGSSWLESPHKFEAGTPPIAQAIGLAAAIDYLKPIGFATISAHESALCRQLIERLRLLKKVRLIGPVDELMQNGHLVSFIVDGMHGHDIVAYLDQYGIAVRAGHHCAQPLATRLGIDALVRVSFSIYNNQEEVDRLANALDRLVRSL